MAYTPDMVTVWIGAGLMLGAVFLLIRFVNRYGPVEQGWLGITREELALLEEHHRRTARPGRPPKRSGRRLYHWAMGAHEGLMIYDGGLFAKFCLGRKGKNTFVLWEEVAGIYRVECKVPMAFTAGIKAPPPPKGRPTMWTGRFRPEWTELQVETFDGRVFAIDSRYHSLDEVSGIINRRMGTRWEQVYHPRPPLTSNIFEGDLYVHKMIRDLRAGGGPKGEAIPLHWDSDHM